MSRALTVLAALAATAAAASCGGGNTGMRQSNPQPTPSPMSASQIRETLRQRCEQAREQIRKQHPDAYDAGCNYGEGTLTTGRDAPQPPPPVTQQVHDALVGALHGPSPAPPTAARHPRLAYIDVGACAGPTAGGAGAYRCATAPRGPTGVRSVTVDVRADGSWASRPLPVRTTFHGHRTTAQSFVWGVGLRLPR
jgi:hypothetical protein